VEVRAMKRIERVIALVGLVLALAEVAPGVHAQPAALPLRIALLPQWTVNQHGGASPLLLQAVERGVVDRPVFAWQRGWISRSSLVWKPVRVLAPPEAAALGGRGAFQPATLLPPGGPSAWTMLSVVAQTAQPGDVLVVEVGGEINTIRQVLQSVMVASPAGLQALRLAPRALIAAEGIPVVQLPFGRPVALARGPDPFRGVDGVSFLVARSLVPTIPDAAVTPNGPADRATDSSIGDWREGDRVFVRVTLEALRAGAPGIVLGWKDRVETVDRGDRLERHPLFER
jgi:hypothetical protein